MENFIYNFRGAKMTKTEKEQTRNLTEEVYALCAKVPKGKVTTYAEVARALGNKSLARVVGNALNKNRSTEVPCHRVVKSNLTIGGFAFGTDAKIALLKKEGIEIEEKIGKRANRKIQKIARSEFLYKFD